MTSEACLESPPNRLLQGIGEFNAGLYFECHETLEELWMAEPRDIRRLYQGILQIGVALYHLQRGRYRPAVTLLRRGSGYLQPFAPHCQGVDVNHLLNAADRCRRELERIGPGGVGEFDWALAPRVGVAFP